MDMLNCKVNGIAVSVPAGSTILEAARAAGIEIPTLCYMKEINAIGACRICVVEATGARGLVPACVYPVTEGMEIQTNNAKIQAARKTTLELILSTHDKKCLSCPRSTNCELQKLCNDYGVTASQFEGFNPHYEIDDSAPHLVRDNNKCILCRRCIAVCNQQFVGILGANDRGIDTNIGQAFKLNLNDTPCISCGQCTVVCPTGALTEKDDTEQVWAALADPSKHVVMMTAPAVRAALGEEFGMPIGTLVTGKMVSALRRLGFKKVFDTNFGADLTIMEEATELMDRIQNGGTLPMITSCCPGWVNYAEINCHELHPHLSSCKSPQEMFGAILKSYYCEKNGIDPKDMFVVSVMPCTGKKYEKDRAELSVNGLQDVDAVLTTRELGKLIRRSGIQFTKLPDEEFDNDIVGDYTGAGVIFGATGGVMEAALRTAAYMLTNNEIEPVALHAVRGLEGVKEATYNLAGKEIRVAVAHGMKNAQPLLDEIQQGTSKYHFIEIMACLGGCIAGGGQPYVQPCFLPNEDANILDTFRAKRAAALYQEDESKALRASHKNPQIKTLYESYLEKPNSHKAHELLHTHYIPREKFPD